MTPLSDPSDTPARPAPRPAGAERIDVVVVTHKSAEVVGRLLDSLPAAMAPMEFRVVVVDNASPDRTREVVVARGDCDLVEAPNEGYAAGINRGVAALGGTGPILVLNPDLMLAPGSVPQMAALLARPGTGVVVPLLREADGTTSRSLRRRPTLMRSTGLGDSRFPLLSEVVNEPEAYGRIHEVEWATGAMMLVKRGCYEAVGGFDETFFMYSEETEFCARARESGYATVFTPRATAVHGEGASGRNPDLYAMQVLNRIRLYRRSHRLPSSVALFGLALAREAVWALRGSADSRAAVRALVSPAHKPGLLPWTGGPLTTPRSVPRRIGRA